MDQNGNKPTMNNTKNEGEVELGNVEPGSSAIEKLQDESEEVNHYSGKLQALQEAE